MTESMVNERIEFETRGYLKPRRLFTAEECLTLKTLLLKAPPPLDWAKGHAASSVAFSQLARDPRIVDTVVELLGEDVMLWGASLVERESGQIHPWHTDIETSTDTKGTVSVWIGLENTRPESSLFLLPGSHHFGSPIQEQAQRAIKSRAEVTAEDVCGWARQLGGEGEIVQPPVNDGEAIFFDGRLWHGSHNGSDGKPRLAVLLQYARPEIPIHIPDLNQLEYPFQLKEDPRPPCIMVHGSTKSAANRIVATPTVLHKGTSSWCGPLRMPLAEGKASGFKSQGLFAGATRCLTYLECHASVLSSGQIPHDPHIHAEEEVLVVVEGRAELEVVRDDGGVDHHSVAKGSCAYYPAGQAHTIHNVSDEPVVYVMFKWSGGRPGANFSGATGKSALKTAVYSRPIIGANDSDGEAGFFVRHLFHGPTAQLSALHCHYSALDLDAGYAPHVDAYDVGIVLLSGSVETLNRRMDAPGVIFYSAGEPHGIRNAGDEPASYLVFEFHGVAGGNEPAAILSWLIRGVPVGLRARIPDRLRRLLKKQLLGR